MLVSAVSTTQPNSQAKQLKVFRSFGVSVLHRALSIVPYIHAILQKLPIPPGLPSPNPMWRLSLIHRKPILLKRSSLSLPTKDLPLPALISLFTPQPAFAVPVPVPVLASHFVVGRSMSRISIIVVSCWTFAPRYIPPSSLPHSCLVDFVVVFRLVFCDGEVASEVVLVLNYYTKAGSSCRAPLLRR